MTTDFKDYFQANPNMFPVGYSELSQFNPWRGAEVYAIDAVNFRSGPGMEAAVVGSASKGAYVGKITGKVYKVQGGTTAWLEIEAPVRVDKIWVSGNYLTIKFVQRAVEPSGGNSKAEAERILTQIVDYDRATFANLATASALLEKARNQGKPYTTEANSIQQLFNKVKARQDEISGFSWLQVVKDAISPNLGFFLRRILTPMSLGEPVTLTILGVTMTVKFVIGFTIVAVAAITTTVIMKLQTAREKSKIEFDESKTIIQQILNKLSPEDRQILTSEINNQLQAAYQSGSNAQWWKSYGSIAKGALLIGGGVLLAVKGIPWLIKSITPERN